MKTVFLTGASGEIGRAIVHKFNLQGYKIIAPTRQEMDLADEKSIDAFLAGFNQPLDVFIHCAGFNEPKMVNKITPEDLHKTMLINSLSFYKMIHHFTKHNQLNQNGHILGVSSIYGFISRKGRFSYSASKFCLKGMVKTLALELGKQNIKANVIAPGFVDTNLTRKNNTEKMIASFKQKIPLGRLASTEDIAEAAYFLCSDQNRYITGQEIVIDGGYSVGGFEYE
jgi:3-oxoacyl-[acyl-carrier protein] reductase